MKTRLIVSALIKKGDSYLFGRKSPGIGPYPDTWHLIGGGVDLEEENLEEALRREIKEETGIEVTDIEKLSFDEDSEPNKKGELTHYIFLVFEATYKSGVGKANDDIVELKWIHQSDIKNISLNRPSIKLFSKIGLL